MGKLLKVIEAAARLAVSRALAYKWVQQGLLRSVQMPGCVRIDEDDLEAFIESRKVGGGVAMRR